MQGLAWDQTKTLSLSLYRNYTIKPFFQRTMSNRNVDHFGQDYSKWLRRQPEQVRPKIKKKKAVK
jgi:hypothetical protein